MKVRIEFECEIYSEKSTPWFAVNDEIIHTNLECVENLLKCLMLRQEKSFKTEVKRCVQLMLTN